MIEPKGHSSLLSHQRYRALADALDRIRHATIAERAWVSARAFARLAGCDYFVMADVAKLADCANDALLHAFPTSVTPLIERYGSLAGKKSIRRDLEKLEPLWLSDVLNDGRYGHEEWSVSLRGQIGPGDALIVPIRKTEDDALMVFAFGGAAPDRTERTRTELSLVALAVYDRYVAIRIQRETSLLSRREVDCLALLTEGTPDREIAEALCISARTVRYHIDSAKAKLGASTRVAAVAKVLRVTPT